MNFHANDGFIFELYTCVVYNALRKDSDTFT